MSSDSALAEPRTPRTSGEAFVAEAAERLSKAGFRRAQSFAALDALALAFGVSPAISGHRGGAQIMIDCTVLTPGLCLPVCVLSKAPTATPGRSTRERWLSSFCRQRILNIAVLG